MALAQSDFVNEIVEIRKLAPLPQGKEIDAYFFQQIKHVLKLASRDKEIIIFSSLQIFFIIFSYFLFIQSINVLSGEYSLTAAPPSPQSVTFFTFLNALTIVALFLAMPFGLLNACIGAAYLLRLTGKQPTLRNCFRVVLPKTWNILLFYVTDAWKTIQYPKVIFTPMVLLFNNEKIASKYASNYQAWKLAIIGIVPSLLAGRDMHAAGRESASLMKMHIKDALLLSHGYLNACVLVCMLPTLGFILWYVPNVINANIDVFATADLYIWLSVPIILCFILIQVLLKPIFILSSVKLYVDFIQKTQNGKLEEAEKLPQIKD